MAVPTLYFGSGTLDRATFVKQHPLRVTAQIESSFR